MTPSFYVRNPEAHGLVSSSALSICSSTVNFCCSAHSPQLLKGQYAILKFKNLRYDANPNGRRAPAVTSWQGKALSTSRIDGEQLVHGDALRVGERGGDYALLHHRER